MKTANLTPLGDRVVVERVAAEEKQGGIYIPEHARRPLNWARVITLGKGLPGFTFTVKPGDLVMLPPNIRTDIDFDGRKVIVIREKDLFAVTQAAA